MRFGVIWHLKRFMRVGEVSSREKSLNLLSFVVRTSRTDDVIELDYLDIQTSVNSYLQNKST